MNLKLRRPLLGILGAAAAFGLGFACAEYSVRPSEVAAARVETLAATFDSDIVVGDSRYETYGELEGDWIVTLGGNNKSVGTNAKSRSQLGLTGDYAKYVPENNQGLASETTAVICKNALQDIGRVEVSWGGGKGNNRGSLHLVYSDTNDAFEEVEQLSISSATSYAFSLEQTLSGYFAVIWQDSGSSGDYRFDNVIIDFYSVYSDAETVPVSGIEVVSPSESIYEGTTIELSAVVTPDDATVKTVEWSLDNDEIATIDQNGVLKAISEGTVTVIATATDGSGVSGQTQIEILHSDATRYLFGEHEDFLANWNSDYEKRSLTFTDSTGEQLFVATFSSANKQSQTITDMPVSKGGTLTITSTKDMLGIEFGFKQWTTKIQTATLTVGAHSEKMSFPDDGTSIAYHGETAFREAVVSMSNNSNQIGWEYVSITWAPEASSDANAFAEAFLEEPLCDGGVTAPDVENWDNLAALYEETLTEEDKAFFASAVPDEEGTLVEQCVARYDYIVGKYGSDVYQDFMGRSPEPLNYGLDVRSQMPEGTTAWICAAGLLAATAALGGAYIVRRRRESR